MHAVQQTIGWLACAIYSTIPCFWLLIHPHAEFWRSRRFSAYYIVVPIWLAMWTAMAALTYPWRHWRFYPGPWGWLPAAILFYLGFWLYRKAGASFSWKQLGGFPELHGNSGEHRLVTDGIRQRMRHPVYLAHLLEMLGWCIGTGLFVCYALTAFAILTGAVMIRTEDAELERRFGAEFRAYREAVTAILPRVL